MYDTKLTVTDKNFNASFTGGKHFGLSGFAQQVMTETGDYNNLINKPKIEGVTLEGDKTFEELTLVRIKDSDIDDILYG